MRWRFKSYSIIVLLCAGVVLSAKSDWEKAAELRKAEDYSKAERLLSKYASPANFESFKSAEKIEFLRGLLELAHIRALKDDVPGSLALLNWAEARNDSYQRAIACVKYAEILLDIGELERASAYLKNADEIIRNRATDESAGLAIGQGGEVADAGASWRHLREESEALKAEIEAEEVKQKFGATYGNYVKLRRMQVLLKRSKTPRYLKEAIELADELVETDPASQFAAAAGYLKGEIMASRLTENSHRREIREVKEYLEKFVRQQPDGLYRGEALMLLGKISLEIEWDSKEAEKHYSRAFEYFRKAREKRDAVSLYAAMNDDLKSQTTPTQKPTTLNQWKRIVYHDEDPLKLYNTANAPVWYIDDKEKDCIYRLGLLAFANGKYDLAKSYWERILSLSPDIATLDQRLPNVQTRLLQACRLNAMAFWPEEKASIRSSDLRLRLLMNEYLILIERFDDAYDGFDKLSQASNPLHKAIAYMGMIISIDLTGRQGSKEQAEKLCNWILQQKQLSKEPIYARAVLFAGQLKTSRNDMEKQALPFFEQYVEQFPKGRDIRVAKYDLAKCYLKMGQLHKAEALWRDLSAKEDIYSENLLKRINRHKAGGGTK
ncbi:MAG: tetratricopeptide repeat protein [Victivallales bacterium]|nr:tetratricopeptide repeat protein [Victivallales bacterium]